MIDHQVPNFKASLLQISIHRGAEKEVHSSAGVKSVCLTPKLDNKQICMMEQFTKRVGVPFRETHHIAGAAVALAESEGIALTDLCLAALRSLHPAFDEDVTAIWSYERSVEQRDVLGGSSRRAVREQITTLRQWLG